jgi:hypothetical protein
MSRWVRNGQRNSFKIDVLMHESWPFLQPAPAFDSVKEARLSKGTAAARRPKVRGRKVIVTNSMMVEGFSPKCRENKNMKSEKCTSSPRRKKKKTTMGASALETGLWKKDGKRTWRCV